MISWRESAATFERYSPEFNILNKSEAGGLGGGKIKWTYESCKTEASNYSNRSRFSECKRRAYDKCIKEGWLDDFYPKK